MEVPHWDAYRAAKKIERLMCEVEFWEVCFLRKVLGLFYVLPFPLPSPPDW